MKKLFLSTYFFMSLIASTVSMASTNTLSIALKNLSDTPVQFAPTVDPGYIPTVQANEDYILAGDFMAGCIQGKCEIYINPVDGSQSTLVNGVSKGTRIFYQGPGQYVLDTKAKVHSD